MRLGVLLEPEGESRVAIVPNSVSKLGKAGFEVLIESGAGSESNYSDSMYESKGAKIVSRDEALSADLLVTIHMPNTSTMNSGQMLACVADPFRHPQRVRDAMAAGITLLSMDMIPRRLSRAQSMDVNSSQDNLAGYKAVLMGSAHIAKAIPMMTTSAGTVKAAKFVIMGSGVAGLQAIATAKRLDIGTCNIGVVLGTANLTVVVENLAALTHVEGFTLSKPLVDVQHHDFTDIHLSENESARRANITRANHRDLPSASRHSTTLL